MSYAPTSSFTFLAIHHGAFYNIFMILVCPLCQKRYLVKAAMFAHGPRTVRCANCKHSWSAEPPNGIDVIATTEHEAALIRESPAVTEAAQPIPQGSNLPVIPPSPLMLLWLKVRWWLFAVFVIWTLLWMVNERQHIARRWTFLTPVYNSLGLYIYYPGDELEFDQVRSELKFEGGITKLNLKGKVWNRTKNIQKVPNIVAQAVGSDGHVIQSWQIDAPQATLAPDEEASFSSSMNAPKGNIINVNLNFVETKDDE